MTAKSLILFIASFVLLSFWVILIDRLRRWEQEHVIVMMINIYADQILFDHNHHKKSAFQKFVPKAQKSLLPLSFRVQIKYFKARLTSPSFSYFCHPEK
jgi:predicted nucleic-acid-binding protein